MGTQLQAYPQPLLARTLASARTRANVSSNGLEVELRAWTMEDSHIVVGTLPRSWRIAAAFVVERAL